uniref:C2H2-type domain-containing protein n=1 Tax=Peronospora matthiolae TaxID=2874970 RepID=A0AAV1VNU3_9STRA
MDIYRATAPRVPTGSPGSRRVRDGSPPPSRSLRKPPAAARGPRDCCSSTRQGGRMLPDRGTARVCARSRNGSRTGCLQGPSDPEDSESSDRGAPDDDMPPRWTTTLPPPQAGSHTARPSRGGYHAARGCCTGSCHDRSRPHGGGPGRDVAGSKPSTPPSPPLVLRLNGKRRRLSDDGDDDPREQAEQLLLEDVEAGPMNSALWPSTASALPASVLAVYAHNAQRFTCTLCAYTASSFASLKRHRDSRHRRISFLDRFSAGCACGTPFVSRLAAANHARACASLRDTSAATASAAGDLSPTAGAVNATATVADTEPVLPRQDPPVLTVSPHSRAPLMTGQQSQDGAPRSQGSCVVVSRIADRLLPLELTEEEETKAGDSDDEDVNDDPDMDGE